MLNARSISASSMPPARCSQVKSGGTVQLARSRVNDRPSGSVRGRFSVMPPPLK